jgi:hypothetical protein
MQKLPLGIRTFEDIRSNDYLYVDKTEVICNMVSSGKVYFLSRPRRFGKSLLVSTLESLFTGRKELFGCLLKTYGKYSGEQFVDSLRRTMEAQ